MDALIKPLRPGRAEGLPESEFLAAPARADLPRPSRKDAEEAVKTLLAYIGEDEYVEVTPKSIRLRKAVLDPHERKRISRAKEAAA